MRSFLLLVFILPNIGLAQIDQNEWITLFNGTDLDGWDIKFAGYELNDNLNNTVRVEDGVLRIVYEDYESFENQFGHIFYQTPYSHYRLQLEYRFIGDQPPNGPAWAFRNNGVMIHSQSAQSMLRDQDFPISLEAQLLGGNGTDDRSTGNLCTPGTHVQIDGELITEHCINSSSKTYHGDQWVNLEIVALSDSLIYQIIEKDTVFTFSKPIIGGGVVSNYDQSVKVDGKALTEGYIALQAESHPTEFRNIRLLNLKGCKDQKATNFKDYVVKHDQSECIYD